MNNLLIVDERDDLITVGGSEFFEDLDDEEMPWMLLVEDAEFFEALAAKTNCTSREVRADFREWLTNKLGEQIFLLVAEYIAKR